MYSVQHPFSLPPNTQTNINHVCCESKPLVKDILNVLDSFNLTQWVTGPPHKKGHTLDLVLSQRFGVYMTEISELCLSGHFPAIFTITLRCSLDKSCTLAHKRQARNHLIAPQSSITFLHYRIINSVCESVEDNSDSFNSTCTDILDLVAPLRTKRSKPFSEPCLNEYTHTLRHKCSRAERRWENNRSYVSLQVFKDGISVYQECLQ